MSVESRHRAKRRYRPKVEPLDVFRLLDGGLAPALLATAIEPGRLPGALAPPIEPISPPDAWDAALGQSQVAELLRGPTADPEAVRSGLAQLDRYLGRAWARAGIAPQAFEDCTQAVYVTLLQNLGRRGFDRLAADVGWHGIRAVLNWGTADGPDFFRAVDMVKKRSLRLKSFQALDERQAGPAASDGVAADRRGALHEAIARTLSPREAALIRGTLAGKTPAEIAQDWGVAPKTVSNEKTRALQKLRAALVAELGDE